MRQSRPSFTATKIARGIVFVTEDPRVRELLPPGTVELNSKLLTEAQLIKPWMVELYRKPWFRSFAHWGRTPHDARADDDASDSQALHGR